jgi:PAS domain S-box-containing protein
MIAKGRRKKQQKHEHLDDAPLPITICRFERDSLIIEYANRSALSLFDSSNSNLVGYPLSEILPEAFSEEIVKQIYDDCIVKGQSIFNKSRRLRQLVKDNTDVLWFNITTQPVRDDANKVVAVISFFIDVTDSVDNKEMFPREHQLGKLFKNAPVGVVCYRDVEFIVDFANDKALEMWGKTLSEVQGRKVDEIFPEVKTDPFISKRHAESVAKLKQGEVHIVNEVELVFTRNGALHQGWFNYIHEPYRDEDGKIIGMLAVAIEVTDQVLARNKLRLVTDSLEQQVKDRTRELENTNIELEQKNFELIDSQSFLQQLIDSSVELIAVVDKDLKYLTVNSAFEKTTKLRSDEVIGRSVEDVPESAINSSQLEALNSALKGLTVNLNTYKATSSGIYLDTHFIPLMIKDQIEGVIIMARDVSKIVKAESELQNAIRQLEDAQQLAKLGSWEWNVGTGAVEWSDEMYRIYGYSDKFPVDFNRATERMRPKDAENSRERTKRFVGDAITRYKSTGERFFDMSPIEFTVLLPDGSNKQVRSSGKIELTDGGELYRLMGAIQDITEIRLTEQQLASTNAQLHEKNTLLDSILSNSSNGISVSQLIFDEAGEVIDAQTILANDAAVKYIGLPRDLYLTRPATFFDPNIIASSYGQACIHTLKSGEPFITQYFLAYSSRWLELTVSRMDESHLIHIFTDVTEMKEAQLKLEQSIKDLKKSNTNLEDFAYAASHDLKEPLRKFQFFTGQLKKELKDVITEHQRNIITKLESTNSRMQSLVNDLLEYSYVTKGIAQVERVDLNLTVKNVLQDLELEIQNKQAIVIVPTLPIVQGNGRQLEQVFQNLIGNALKYGRPGLNPNIEIIYKQVNGRDVLSDKSLELLSQSYHFIEISDNGIGFDQMHADRIFNIFTRLHGKEDYKGSGIGLSIVRKVIESHSGFVWATSEPNAGASFKFILPIA